MATIRWGIVSAGTIANTFAVAARSQESAVVTHAASLAFQQDMDRVRDKF